MMLIATTTIVVERWLSLGHVDCVAGSMLPATHAFPSIRLLIEAPLNWNNSLCPFSSCTTSAIRALYICSFPSCPNRTPWLKRRKVGSSAHMMLFIPTTSISADLMIDKGNLLLLYYILYTTILLLLLLY